MVNELVYRRADERGGARGAFNLGVVLHQRGDVTGAMAAYARARAAGGSGCGVQPRRASVRGGDFDGAEASWRRSVQRGNSCATQNLDFLAPPASRAGDRRGRHRRRRPVTGVLRSAAPRPRRASAAASRHWRDGVPRLARRCPDTAATAPRDRPTPPDRVPTPSRRRPDLAATRVATMSRGQNPSNTDKTE